MAGIELQVFAVGGYVAIIGLIGYHGFRKTSDEADFLIAGREVGSVVGAGTLLASQISASTVIGAVGIHYVFGVGFVWVWFGIIIGWLIALVFIAPQLRRFGGMTVPDFVGTRYADDGADGTYARAVTATLIVGTFTIFLMAQYTAGALIIRQMLDVSEPVGIGLTAAIAVVYTAVGGMRASVLTDFVQSVVLVSGLALAMPLVVAEVGGVGVLVADLQSINPNLLGQMLPLTRIGGFVLASMFGIAAAPMEISRFYAMRDENTVRTAIKISLVGQAIIALSVLLLGLSARVLFPDLGTPDLAAIILTSEVLPPVFGTVLLLAFLSAIFSTIDSVMLVASAGVAHDIYASVVQPTASERRVVWANRLAVVFVGAIPAGMALYRDLFGSLITLITLLYLSLVGAMLFVPVFFGLHWQRATTAGGIGAAVAGFVTVALWYLASDILSILPDGVAALVGDPVVPGVFVSLVVMVTLSLLTSPPSTASTAPFFSESE
jgi:SSS family transporter